MSGSRDIHPRGARVQGRLVTVTTTFRRPFKDRFEAACDEEDRSMSAQLRRLAEQWLDNRKAVK